MKRYVVVLVLSGLMTVSLLAESAENLNSDIEGTWVAVGGERGGQKIPEKVLMKTPTLTFTKKEFQVAFGGKVVSKGTYKVKTGKPNNSIDLMDSEGPYKDKVSLGIYKIEGDTLTMAMAAMPGRPRPTEFTSKEGSDVEVSVCKRKK